MRDRYASLGNARDLCSDEVPAELVTDADEIISRLGKAAEYSDAIETHLASIADRWGGPSLKELGANASLVGSVSTPVNNGAFATILSELDRLDKFLSRLGLLVDRVSRIA